ncbi:MAG: hypothetical protein ACE14P_14110 [Methanotrichaceae archaeon]
MTALHMPSMIPATEPAMPVTVLITDPAKPLTSLVMPLTALPALSFRLPNRPSPMAFPPSDASLAALCVVVLTELETLSRLDSMPLTSIVGWISLKASSISLAYLSAWLLASRNPLPSSESSTPIETTTRPSSISDDI